MIRRLVALAAAVVLLVSAVTPGLALVRQPSPDASLTPVLSAPASEVDQTKVPHYFGPYPNWANSPLTLPDATVTITGNGTGATAEATVGANGAVTALTLTDGGQGYSNAKVDITGAGSGATADVTIIKKGAVVSVTVNTPGAGYTAPTVAFSGNGGATATAYGGVDAVRLTREGLGYRFPTVDFDLPGNPNGVQAHGHAICADPTPTCQPASDLDTVTVTGIVVDDAGSGYTTAPKVTVRNGTLFDPIAPGDGFVAAVADSTLRIQSVVVNDPGTNYGSTPTVTINDPDGAGATATAALDNGVISTITLKKGGSGYVTPGGIRKFVDGLPGLTEAGANNLGQYIPVAVPDTTTFPDDPTTPDVDEGADYYVIAVVQTREQMSSSLPGSGLGTGTLLREYVQLETSVVQGKHVALQTSLLDGTTTPTLMPGGTGPTQAVGVDDPHFLGPLIVANKDRAVRITFYNLLPAGTDGDLFLPTDSTLMGSGMAPGAMGGDVVDDGTVVDGVRNPVCSEYPKSLDLCFQDPRATLHLHGGITPWISDGTPHQWITPADENTPWPQGVSVGNVPDMIDGNQPAGVPDCSAENDGCQTFYYTNQQSARLMFYHDHAWGITRLNVYAGEAAGYIITDDTEQKLFGQGGTYADMGEGIPLVIQDRTFVPSADQLAQQDPTWDAGRWGDMGNLWYHHVYMPAQNPSDPSGMSAYGRWMYGPWFWPPATPDHGPIANPYYNMDPNGPDGTPGTADDFSTPLAVACNLDDPSTWQYDTDPYCEPELIPGTPNISVGMEQFNDTPIVNGTAYPTTSLDPKAYRFRILNAANDRFWNLSWYVADSTGTEVALKASEVAAAQTDINIVPTPDEAISPKGPDWIMIGSEGGFLPAPAVIPAQPTTWITDPTRFDVGNVDKHSMLLAPAERSDVIVDFSKYAGKTLILYNDAPAAFPARVANYDYYTGGPDTGAGVVLPGYGPNTRTIMQVKIAANGAAPAFNVTALNNLFKHHADGSGVFESGQHPIIVGQAAYNSAYGTSFAASGNCTNPDGTNKCDGLARINQQGGDLFRFDNLKGTNPQLKIPLQPKALHDEMNSAAFDEFGRMTANLGLEAVPATPAGQNILLYPFVAPPTEVIDGTNLPKGDIDVQAISDGSDGTQIWKITHNGVDTHPIHFHLYDVQVLNRVTWDNIIIPTEASELGWKDTVRISPLEDTIVALRPIVPTLPFEIPNSVRPLDPMMELGTGINGSTLIVDPNGVINNIQNALVNFGWEYVYHCHILSHEEMDMMRPVLLAVPPFAPGSLSFDANTGTLTFNDNSITETSLVVQKSLDAGVTWTDVPSGTLVSPLDQPNLHRTGLTVIDSTFDPNVSTSYRVEAINLVGYERGAADGYPVVAATSFSETLLVGTAAGTTTTLSSSANPSVYGQNVTFTAAVSPATATGSVQFNIDGNDVGSPVALTSGSATFSVANLGMGNHDILATYLGGGSFTGSASTLLTQTVTMAPSTTVVTSSLNPSTWGQGLTTFTATVTGSAATPTGSVQFDVDGAITDVPLANGVATYVTPMPLTAGGHPVTATYLGSTDYGPSSGSLTQVVNKVTTATTVSSSDTNAKVGDTVNLTATTTTVAAPAGAGTPTGNVEFSLVNGSTKLVIATASLGANSVTNLSWAVQASQVGTWTLTATYLGDTNFATSTGTLKNQRVR